MRSRSIALALAVIVLLAPAVSRADDRATAQQLFQQGKALLSAGDVAAACPKFEGAAQLSPTPGVRLNLADCWTKLGRTASAWAKYDEAVAMAERSGDIAAAEAATAGRAALFPTLSYLTVVVPENVAAEHIEVTRDGEPLPAAAWNTSVPVDPGDRVIVANARGRKTWTTTVHVAANGAKESVSVPPLETDALAIAPAPEAPGDRGQTRRTLAWIAAGAGIAAVGVGSYFGVETISQKNEYQAHLGANGCLDSTCQSASHDAYASGNVATAAFIAGGALLATGVVLWVTAPTRQASPTAGVTADLGPGRAGLGLRGAW